MTDKTVKTKAKKAAPKAKGAGKKTCKIQGCKRGYRAKGFCFFHYSKWRRGEIEAVPRRWKTCGKEECKKKVLQHGLCKEHFDAWTKSRKGAKQVPAEAPAA